ncbi:hypothetical protein NDU88_009375, partial [Pleurodeles waltl]
CCSCLFQSDSAPCFSALFMFVPGRTCFLLARPVPVFASTKACSLCLHLTHSWFPCPPFPLGVLS